jgi:hypothetical protein
MNLKEINELINVRNYIATAANSSYNDRHTCSMLNGMLILVDKKIIDLLQSEDFKEYIEYKDVRKAIEDAAKHNNIKSGLKR